MKQWKQEKAARLIFKNEEEQKTNLSEHQKKDDAYIHTRKINVVVKEAATVKNIFLLIKEGKKSSNNGKLILKTSINQLIDRIVPITTKAGIGVAAYL